MIQESEEWSLSDSTIAWHPIIPVHITTFRIGNIIQNRNG
jgi:hypothetical protein